MNVALGAHDKRLQALTASYLAFNAAVSGASGGMKQFITNNNTVNNTLNTTNNVTRNVANSVQNMGNAANRAGGQFDGMLGTMLKYRAVSAIFEGVQRSVGAAVTAMYDMERQAARVQRVSGPGATPGIRADIAVEAARTGADVKDIGEAYYQLKTQIKDNATAFAALNTAMNLHIGLEADARDTTRAMLQIYNQFGDQLGENVDQSEKLRRAGELLAVMWKGSDAEVSDLIASLKYLGPIAQAAHVPLEQVAATISALTHEGVRGRMGGTESGQLLGQIIKNFNPATGLIENKGATLQAALTPQGGIDLLGTMRNFNEVASRMPVETAMKFSQAISGTMNAWRLFGSVNPEFLRVIQEKLDDATKATHGLSSETDDLRKTMTTTAVEWDRVWRGMFSTIANLIDLSPIRGWLHGIAEDLERLTRQQREAQSDERSTAAALAPGANVRSAVTVLRNAVKQTLEMAQSDPFRGTPAESFLHRPMDMALQGTTSAERAELIRRYGVSRVAGSPDRLDEDAMRRDLAIMDRQLADPNFGRGLGPANPFGPGMAVAGAGGGLPGFSVRGGYVDPEAAKELKRKQKEALDAAIKAAEKAMEAANIELRRLKERENLAPDSDPVLYQVGKVKQAETRLNALKGDTNAQRLLDLGLEGAGAKNIEDIDKFNQEKEKGRQEERKERAAILEYYAETARTQYGFGDLAYKRAKEAQAAAEAATTGSAVDLLKLKEHATGPMATYLQEMREDAAAKDRKAAESRQRTQEGVDSVRAAQAALRDYNEAFAQDLGGPSERRMRARQRGLRPNQLGPGYDARQEGAMSADVADIQKTIDLLVKTVPDATEEIGKWRDKLADASAALTDFRDSLEVKAHQRQIQAQEDAFELSTQRIGRLHGLRFNKDEASAFADEMQKLAELLAAEQTHVRQVAATAGLDPDDSRLRDARKREQAARERLEDYPVEYANRRYAETYYRVRDDVRGAFMDFFHGQGDLGTMAQRVGGGIVDAALDAQIKRFTDPLITTVTQEILALENLTDAVSVLNGTIGGGGSVYANGPTTSGGLAGAVAAGVQAGVEDVGGGIVGGAAGGAQAGAASSRGGAYKQSDLQKGVVAGLSAYSIGAQSASQGTNLGNLLGSAAAGWAIGGPIGAGVGVVANLIGGLFHHKDKPKEEPRDLNPALYNAPSAFDLAAYHYSAYGILPRVQDVGFAVTPQNAPVFNVYIDGAKSAARVEIGRQSSSIEVSLGNTFRDRYAPV